jgi:hypothetical protein
MPDYSVLRALVASDPSFTGQSDQAVADVLNAPTEVVVVPLVPLSVLAMWAARTGVRARIEAGTQTASPVQGICLTLRDLFTGLTGPSLDLSSTDNLAMLDALVTAGIMSAADRTSLLALQNHPTSRALQLAGWNVPVQAPDVAWVRSH